MNARRFNDFLAQARQNWSRPRRGGYLHLRRCATEVISSLKAAIKRDVSRPEIQARMDDRTEARGLGIPLGEMRTRLPFDALQRCMGVITAAKAYQWFRFMQTYLPRCLDGEQNWRLIYVSYFAFICKVHSICLQIHADYVTFWFETEKIRFLRKECKEHSIILFE